jgi:acyl-CoA thioester hydrolase
MDSFGHANNAVFLNYLEAGRSEFMLQAGLSFQDFHVWHTYPVVRHAELDFRVPICAPEEIVVTGEFEALRRTGCRAHQTIRKASTGELACVATIDLVFTDSDGRPIATPSLFRERILDIGDE